MSRLPLTEPTLLAVLASLAQTPPLPPAAALFSNAGRDRGELLHRASAPDPLAALDGIAAWLARQSAARHGLLVWTSGNLDAAAVERCLAMDIPFLLFAGQATEAGILAASRSGLTAIGHCRNRCRVYAGSATVQSQPPVGLA